MDLDLDQAFYDRMAGDDELVAMLSGYPDADESSGVRPAIFTDEEVPENAEYPFIWTCGEVSVVPDDTKLDLGFEIVRDIGIYAGRNQTDLLRRIAYRVRFLFHRRALEISGMETIIASASGPVKAPTDETADGRIVSVRLNIDT